MHDCVSIMSREVRTWRTGVEACSNVLNGDTDEFLDLALGIHRCGAHPVVQSVVAPALVGYISVGLKRRDRRGPTVSGMTRSTFTGYNASLAAENPVLGLLYKWSGSRKYSYHTLGTAFGRGDYAFGA